MVQEAAEVLQEAPQEEEVALEVDEAHPEAAVDLVEEHLEVVAASAEAPREAEVEASAEALVGEAEEEDTNLAIGRLTCLCIQEAFDGIPWVSV